VAPISYVADVMFPYARDNVQQHLQDSYTSEETQVGGGGRRRQRALLLRPAGMHS
jgi:methionine salvage enolase-phosphatase E1